MPSSAFDENPGPLPEITTTVSYENYSTFGSFVTSYDGLGTNELMTTDGALVDTSEITETEGSPGDPAACTIDIYDWADIMDKNLTDAFVKEWPCSVRMYYSSHLPYMEVMKSVVLYFTLVNACVGLVLNVTNFIVFRTLWQFSCYYVYLSAIALGDLSNIFLNFLIGALRVIFIDLDEVIIKSKILCYAHSYFLDFVSLSSVWLVCVATGNTMMAVLFPLRAHQILSKKSTRIVLIVTEVAIAAWCTYKFRTGGLEVTTSFGYGKCREVSHPLLVNASSILGSFVPAIITLLFNVAIVIRIHRSNIKRRHLANNFVTGQVNEHSRRQNRMARLVIIVSFTFIALVTPNRLLITSETVIHDLTKAAVSDGNTARYEYLARLAIDNHLARQFGFILYQLNFTNNFFIYILTDPRFCRSLMELMCCYKLRRRSSKTSTEMTTRIFSISRG